MNELEDNDIRDKRERLVACVLSGTSKMYLGKEYAEQQINDMDCDSVNALLNRYESILSAQMTKSLGKSIINLYSNLACSVLGAGNQQELSKLSHPSKHQGSRSRSRSDAYLIALGLVKQNESCNI